jgi:hypothetical protein
LKPLEGECWNCAALFGPSSSWTPTDKPLGVFKQRPKPADSPRKEQADTKSSNLSFSEFAAKGLVYVCWLLLWLFIGGFFSLGPLIAHNIEKAVGVVALKGTFLTWIALPVTGLIALARPNAATLTAFCVNVLLWILFVAYLYLRWAGAYPA